MHVPTRPPVSQREWAWITTVTAVAILLRVATLNHVAVEHFDEAVYSSNLFFPAEQGGEYPYRQLYAPPLLPAVIEWSTIFSQQFFAKVPFWWPMLPALVTGIATIPSLWWIGRQWFSPLTGMIAAIILAFHEYHASYSRTALTDVPLSFFLLWAVHGLWIAMKSGSYRDAVIAGVLTSFAWWSKYNGWLPLAISLSGGVFYQLICGSTVRNWTRFLRVWIVSSITAFALWCPVLWDCQKIGGYAKVAENHRGYVQGVARWIPNLMLGYDAFDAFVGWLTLFGLIVGIVARFAFWQNRSSSLTPQPLSRETLLAECLAGAWFWGLFLATPMYHAYSRLWVPWLVVSAIWMSVVISFVPWKPDRSLVALYRAILTICGGACGLIIFSACVLTTPRFGLPSCFENRDAFVAPAQRVKLLSESLKSIVLVGDSDPGLWFQLRELDVPAIPTGKLEIVVQKMDRDRLMVFGPMSQIDDNIQRSFQEHREQLELLEAIPVKLSLVSLLDLPTSQELRKHPDSQMSSVQIYRVIK